MDYYDALLFLVVSSFLASSAVAGDEMKEQTFAAADEWTPGTGVYDPLRCGLPMRPPSPSDIKSTLATTASPLQSPSPFRHRAKRYVPPVQQQQVNPILGGRKVMGGRPVTQGDLPWAVSLHRNGIHLCSGTLVSKRHVLTAAHCFAKGGGSAMNPCHDGALDEEDIASKTEVHIGSICQEKQAAEDEHCRNAPVPRKFGIKSIDFYQGFFNASCYMNDIALLVLNLDEEKGDQIPAQLANHICLVFLNTHLSQQDWHALAVPTVFGWGDDPRDHPNQHGSTTVLQRLEMPSIWSPEECAAKLESVPGDDLLCTIEKVNADACTGDSGGGLISQYEDGNGVKRWFQLGLVSFGENCADLLNGNATPKAQAFTNVTFHRKAIAKYVNLMADAPIVQTQPQSTVTEEAKPKTTTTAGRGHKMLAANKTEAENDYEYEC